MWYFVSPAAGIGSLIGIIILFIIGGFILSLVTAVVLAPGILVTANLSHLMKNQLAIEHLWISSISFSLIFAGAIWYKWRDRYIKRYLVSAVAISMIVGLYTCYISPNNQIVGTYSRMYNHSAREVADESAVIIGNQVNLRSSPSTGSGIVDVLYSNEAVVVKKDTGDWYYIQNNRTGKQGWVYKQYVTLQQQE
ncbi:MAG: Bacterial domain [Sporomusa sp.]|nr:Bacterial domain [Sporomusa sp.]